MSISENKSGRLFHLSSKTGKIDTCRAEQGNCPFTDPEDPNGGHYTTEAEIEAYAERVSGKDEGIGLTTETTGSPDPVSSGGSSMKGPDSYSRRGIFQEAMNSYLNDEIGNLSLKEMDPVLLSASMESYTEYLDYEAPLTKDSIPMALKAASIWHSEQRRGARGDYPKTSYIEHPLRNTLRLLRSGERDASTVVASILHDTLEDTQKEIMRTSKASGLGKASPEEVISSMFSERVLGIVKEVTNDPVPEGIERTPEEKRLVYKNKLAKLVTNSEKSKDTAPLRVKISDLVDNASSSKVAWEEAKGDEGAEGKIFKRAKKYILAMPEVTQAEKLLLRDSSLTLEYRKDLSRKVQRMLENLKFIADKVEEREGDNSYRKELEGLLAKRS